MPFIGGGGGSGGGGLVQLATVTRGSTGALDTGAAAFTSGHGHLRIVAIVRTAAAATTEGYTLRFNGDSGANYIAAYQQGSSTGSSGTVALSSAVTAAGLLTGNNATANYATTVIIDIPFYDNTNWFKTGTLQMNTGQSAVGDVRTTNVAFTWASTTAISQITLDSTAHPLTNSVLTVYGTQ